MMLFSSNADTDIFLEGSQSRKHYKAGPKSLPIYSVIITQHDEPIKGVVIISLKRGKSLDHQGLRIEIIGSLGILYTESSNTQLNCSFLTLSRVIESSGTYNTDQTIPFSFLDVDKSYESYYGDTLTIKYVLRVTLEKNLSSNIMKETEVFIARYSNEPAINPYIKIESGYEDAVQIELELFQLKFHNKDTIIGRIYFHIIRVRLDCIEIEIVRIETLGTGKDSKSNSKVIGSYEILDGPVAKGDSLPIRIFLKSCNITPTYNNINNRASVKYLINMRLKDEVGRTFSKSHEIFIWRTREKITHDTIPSLSITRF